MSENKGGQECGVYECCHGTKEAGCYIKEEMIWIITIKSQLKLFSNSLSTSPWPSVKKKP